MDYSFKNQQQPEYGDDNNNELPTVMLSANLVGEYCLVLYDGEPYVGRVLEFHEKDEDVTVKAMARRGETSLTGRVLTILLATLNLA